MAWAGVCCTRALPPRPPHALAEEPHRPAQAPAHSAAPPTATPCSVLPCSSIVRHISAGAYESPRGANSTATLRLEPLTYNAACDVSWLDADLRDRTNDTSFIVLRHLYITGAVTGLSDGWGGAVS